MTSFSKNVFSIELVPRLLPEPRSDVTDEEAETVYLRIQRPEYSNETIDVGIGEGYSFVDEDGEQTSELKQFIEDENYARINKIGMWNMKFKYPWDFRKKK